MEAVPIDRTGLLVESVARFFAFPSPYGNVANDTAPLAFVTVIGPP